MTITEIQNQGEITLLLDGWLDTLSAPELGERIEKIQSAEAIVLDFEKVEYIASSGLRQVIACYKKAKTLNASFSVIHVNPEVSSIFKLTRLDQKMTIRE